MEPANEEAPAAPLSRHLPSTHSSSFPTTTNGSTRVDIDTSVAVTLTDGVYVTHGSALPPFSSSPEDRSNDRPVSGVIPPYWHHYRKTSRASQTSLTPEPAITLEDHTEDPDSVTSRGLWAKSVSITDYAVVQGMTGIGAYVVWSCRIQTLEGGPITIRMRYSEFDDLRQRLLAAFPHAKHAMPELPPKSVLYKFRRAFLESRRVGLEYFLNCVLLNPEFSGSPVLKDFLFGRIC